MAKRSNGTVRAEEFVLAQLGGAGLLTVLSLLYAALGHPPARIGILLVLMAPAIGLLLPASWPSRKVTARKHAIPKDLPDTLDLLAISVEAGRATRERWTSCASTSTPRSPKRSLARFGKWSWGSLGGLPSRT